MTFFGEKILSLRRQRQRFRTTDRWWLTFLLLHTTSCEDDVSSTSLLGFLLLEEVELLH